MQPFAVLDTDRGVLYTQFPGEVGAVGTLPFPPGTLQEPLIACACAGIRRLWLFGPKPPYAATSPDRFRIRPSKREPHYATAYDGGAPGAFLLTHIAPETWPGLAACRTPAEALLHLGHWQRAFGRLPQYGPASTGTAMLRRLLARYHPQALRIPATPVELPRPADTDILWLNPDAAHTEVPYIHCFDRTAAYLAACSRLRLGVGSLTRAVPPLVVDRPGYYRLHPQSPHPGVTGAFGGGSWLTQPTVEALHCRHPCFTEALSFTDAAELFRPWYTKLRNARRRFQAMADFGPRLIADLRALYTRTIGWLGATAWDRTGDPLYRPDWRDAIVAQNAAVVRQALREAYYPIAGYVDAVYVGSYTRDALHVRDTIRAMRRREGIGSWQHKGCVPTKHLPGSAYAGPRAFVEAFSAALAVSDETRPYGFEPSITDPGYPIYTADAPAFEDDLPFE